MSSYFECDVAGFAKQVGEFRKVMTNPASTDREVSIAHGVLGMFYLNCTVAENSDEDFEHAIAYYKSVTDEAYARGWSLLPDNVIGGVTE